MLDKGDPAAAAVASLVTHGRWVVTGLLVFDLHASRPAVHTWLDVGHGKIGRQDYNRFITEFALYY